MAERRPIGSDSLRISVGETMISVNAALPAADRPLEPNNVIRTQASLDVFIPAYILKGNKQKDQADAVLAVRNLVNQVRSFNSQFLQTLQFAIAAGKVAASERLTYGLTLNQKDLPAMTSEPLTLEVTKNIVKGETSRIAAGGKPMGYPIELADLQAMLTALTPLIDLRTVATEALDNSEQALAALRTEMDACLDKCIKNLEYKYSEEDKSSIRRRLKRFGVPYRNSPNDPFEEYTNAVAPQTAFSFAQFEVANSTFFLVKNTGEATLRLYRTDDANTIPTGDYLTLEAGKELSVQGIELGPAGKYFTAYNPSNGDLGGVGLKRFLED